MNKKIIGIIINEACQDLGVELLNINEVYFTIGVEHGKEIVVEYDEDIFSFEQYTLEDAEDEIKHLIVQAIEDSNEDKETFEFNYSEEDIKELLKSIKREFKNISKEFSKSVGEFTDGLRDEDSDVVISLNLSDLKRNVEDTADRVYREATLESIVDEVVSFGGKTYTIIEDAVREGKRTFDKKVEKYKQEKENKCENDCECDLYEEEKGSCCQKSDFHHFCEVDNEDELFEELLNIDDILDEVLDDMNIKETVYNITYIEEGGVRLARVDFVEFANTRSDFIEDKPFINLLIPTTEEDKPFIAKQLYERFASIDIDDVVDNIIECDITFSEKTKAVNEIKRFLKNITIPKYVK